MSTELRKSKTIYALLVGINDYRGRKNLSGCLNDIKLVEDTLHNLYPEKHGHTLKIVKLTDSDATYDNVITGFRDHLRKAGPEDFAYFHYSGHGSRQPSAGLFHDTYPSRLDESLVLYDSCDPGKYMLADKELAVLASEITNSGAHFTAGIDCCHSGSIFRNDDSEEEINDENGVREYPEIEEIRPLDSYLYGYYSAGKKKRPIPDANFMNMTACSHKQEARETFSAYPGLYRKHGVFTVHLMKMLEVYQDKLDYKTLFQQVRFSMAAAGYAQCPQFEPFGTFNIKQQFLSHKTDEQQHVFDIRYDKGLDKWVCSGGLFSGIAEGIRLRIFSQSNNKRIDKATVVEIDRNESIIETDRPGVLQKGVNYLADFAETPEKPLLVYLEGRGNAHNSIRRWFDERNVVTTIFIDETDLKGEELEKNIPGECRFMLRIKGNTYSLIDRYGDHVLVTHTMSSTKMYERLLKTFNHLFRYQAIRSVNHDDARLGSQQVKVYFELQDAEGNWSNHNSSDSLIKVDFKRESGEWQAVSYRIRVKNNTNTPLQIRPYFMEDVVFHSLPLPTIELPPLKTSVVFEGKRLGIVDPDRQALTHYIKLLVSTDDIELDNSQLALSEITPLLQPILPTVRGESEGTRSLFYDEEKAKYEILRKVWMCRTLTVQITRRNKKLVNEAVSLADGTLQFLPHSQMTTDISLQAASAGTFRNERTPIAVLPQGDGVEVLNFSSTRNAAHALVELKNIHDIEAVTADNPLRIDIQADVRENEYLLPVATDGKEWMVIPHSEILQNGRVQLAIERLPDIDDDVGTRSLGKALKMAFLKIVLRRRTVDELKRVVFSSDGHSQRVDINTTELIKVRNIYLCMHGIIGDALPVAEGVRRAISQNGGRSYDSSENLLLTYDYENLNTPIETIAVQLSEKLEKIGLGNPDAPSFTIVAHSMGGLVIRSMLEQNNKWHKHVKKVVLCGTPNGGSLFGKLEQYRNLITIFMSYSINWGGSVLGFLAQTLTALKAAGELMVTLGQMNIGSEYLKRLSASSDPGIEYHIIAGNLSEYLRDTPQYRIKLPDKIAIEMGSALYGNTQHDIAVSVDSILDVSRNRQPAPMLYTVGCHHLNYFLAEEGIDALAKALEC